MAFKHNELNPIIGLKAIGKKYPLTRPAGELSALPVDFWALSETDLEVAKGESLGIIGRNGAGKTTLLNIIAGTLSPTRGEVTVEGRALGLFNLGVGFQDELSGRENILLNGAILGAPREELKAKLASIIGFSELEDFINMPLGSYSQGMRLRLGFSIIANLDFDILVIDEVLAVGDALFQSKCFERLADFRRQGKTLVITSQNLDLIDRLCDRAILLEHGKILFAGKPQEAIDRYRALLHKEKFSVGPLHPQLTIVEDTKKWADDSVSWNTKLGTKEVTINSVRFLNRWGLKAQSIKSGAPLKITVSFTAKNPVAEPHFGVAIFRSDGAYCYGPNTSFDGYTIPSIKAGKGWFKLFIPKLCLAPGEYRISVAIWDKNETLAYDYHHGFYKLTVAGKNHCGELINIPADKNFISEKHLPNVAQLQNNWDNTIIEKSAEIESVKLFNCRREETGRFFTGEPWEASLDFKSSSSNRKFHHLWVGIYREDGIYCQGFGKNIRMGGNIRLRIPQLLLLPGAYRLSAGVWGENRKQLLTLHHGIRPFKMVFNRQDHGTVYLEHQWNWNLAE